jgi:hypothetical protein
MRKKRKNQFLKRSIRFMLRFDAAELRGYRNRAKQSRLSMVEYARRKILDIPIGEETAAPDTATQETAAV